MKKNLLFTLVSLLLLTACSNNVLLSDIEHGQEAREEVILSSSDKEALSELNYQMNLFVQNSSFEQQTVEGSTVFHAKPNKKKGGFWKWLWRGITTAFADAIGAVIGGAATASVTAGAGTISGAIAGGTVASALVGAYEWGSEPPTITPSPSGLPFKVSNNNTGSLHNETLNTFFSSPTALANYANLSDREQAVAALDTLKRIALKSNMTINTSEEDVNNYVSIASQIKNILNSSDSEEEFYQNIYLLPVDKNLLDVLVTYMKGLQNTTVGDDTDYYLNQMIDFVNKSSVSQNTKQIIKESMYIGEASNNFWQTYINENYNETIYK